MNTLLAYVIRHKNGVMAALGLLTILWLLLAAIAAFNDSGWFWLFLFLAVDSHLAHKYVTSSF